MTPLVSMIVGLFLGLLGVGVPTMRMIKVMEGGWVVVFFLSLVATGNLYIFTNLVVAKNFYFMVANALGAALSVSILAYRRRNKNGNANNS